MDNFYHSFSKGIVKTSGVMNYIQHLYIAQNINAYSDVLEVCCGRCLLVPLLNRYANNISSYVGIDISADNLREAKKTIKKLDIKFPIDIHEMDVTKLTKQLNRKFDTIVYTSSIEHMSKENGILSLENVYDKMRNNGILYLSSPRTRVVEPRKLQYKVHVYEWEKEELELEMVKCGFDIVDRIGLLSEDINVLLSNIQEKYGTQTKELIEEILNKIPREFVEPVITSAFPCLSKEILYVCKKV